jgi:putrescine transport system ATP-binding protein
LAALDRKLREDTQLELKAIQRRLGVTFMIVTHDQDEAMVVADRIAVMAEGQVRQVGPPREVYERPASRFVAEFLGEANLTPDGPGWRLVRPEKMVLSPVATPGGLAGEVAEIAYFGDRTRYVIRQGAGRPWLVSRANAGPPLTLSVGDAAWVSFADEDAVAIPS